MPDFVPGDTLTWILALLVCLAVGILWVFQFANLMSLSDEEFPGRNARICWVAGFVLLWFITPFAFLVWHAGQRKASRSRSPRKRGAS